MNLSNLYKKRGVIIFLSIITFLIIVFVRQSILLKEYGRITICEFVKYTPAVDGPTDADFKVYFQKKYMIISSVPEHKLRAGNKFFIKIVPDSHNMNEVYWNIPVPDTLKYIPENGWDKIPYSIKEY